MPPRAFLAIELSSGTRELLEQASGAFLSEAAAWAGEKWVRPELLHVTVSFIGAMPDEAVPSLLAALTGSLAALPPFELRLAGVRAVRSARHASMVWAELTGDTDVATALHAAVGRAVGAVLGIGPETRAYAPHVTLVRARRPRRVPDDALAAAGRAVARGGKEADRIVSVRTVTLHSSTLGPGGPRYERLGSAPVGGA